MKKHTFAAVATLATTMFMTQGGFAQDQADKSSSSTGQAEESSQADKSSTQDPSSSSAQQAGDRAGQSSDRAGQSPDRAGQAGARAGQAGRAGQSQNMDQKFVEFASTNDQFEIQAARIAEKQAEDDQIKQMARQIAQDHQQSSRKLQQAAQQAGVQVTQQLKPHQQAMLQELQQLEGQEFDRAWLYGQVAGHTKAVLKFRDASQELQNEQLKQFAQQTLPKLQQHLQHAQQIAKFDTAQTAGASERGSGRPGRIDSDADHSTDRPGATDSNRGGARPGAGSPGSSSGSDTSGTDTQNRRGAAAGDTGASSDSNSGGRIPSR